MKIKVSDHMIKSPYVGDESLSLSQALEIMGDCDIRHLPIVQDGILIGLVSERDIAEAKSLPRSSMLKVKDIMKKDLFMARRSASLADTVRYMQEEKLGSVLVVDDNKSCVGIFTTTDALGVLADLLEENENESEMLTLDTYTRYWDSPAQFGESFQ